MLKVRAFIKGPSVLRGAKRRADKLATVGSQRADTLVEISLQPRPAVILEETFYLGGGNAGERELGQLVLPEESYPLRIHLALSGLVQDLAQKDQFVDVVGNGWMTVPVAV